MNVIGTVIIVLVIAGTVLGFIIGLCKGFAKVKSWGVEYLLAALITSLVGGALAKEPTAVKGVVSLVLAVGLILLFGFLSAILRKGFRASKQKKIAKGKKKRGPSGFFDSVFGAVTLAVKGFVIVGVISAFILVALDLSQFAFVAESMADIYGSASYVAFKPYMMDFFYIGLLTLAIKCGYSSGISHVVWGLLVFGMVIFAAVAAYNLAFYVETFDFAADGIAGMLAGGGEVTQTNILIARWALTAGLFLLMLIVVILIGVFVPKLLYAARNSKIFYAVDGIFGAIFATVIALGIVLFFGSLVQPLSVDLEKFPFMAHFTSYFESSGFATYFYNNDLLILFGMEPVLPLHEWLA